ncbi:hypothetical protein B9J75_08180 [Leuconostoc citreum]|nr:hypothetical protein B9J75_08180 [Leuconostoc citreum]
MRNIKNKKRTLLILKNMHICVDYSGINKKYPGVGLLKGSVTRWRPEFPQMQKLKIFKMGNLLL